MSTFLCSICQTVWSLPNRSNFCSHLATHLATSQRQRTSCELCQKSFHRLSVLNRHKMRLHSEQPIYTCVFLCPICQIVWPLQDTVTNFERHLSNHQLTSDQTKQSCDMCPKKFRNHFELEMHLRTHSGERPYKCRYCEKRFARTKYQKLHELIHTGEKRHECDQCGVAFRLRTNLNHHKRNIHSNHPGHTCTDCGATFRTLKAFNKHKLWHIGDWPCAHCSYKFQTKPELIKHVRAIHKIYNET